MPKNPRKSRRSDTPPADAAGRATTDLRVIGGRFRGKKLAYEPLVQSGKQPTSDRSTLVTRPMKHRVREAIFNLVGPSVADKHALDVFAGTGALGLEALSRGSAKATFIERHVPTASVVRQNISTLGVEEQSDVLITSAFVWCKRDLDLFSQEQTNPPWLVFVSPPYDFYVDRAEEMLDLITLLLKHAPDSSIFVVEADDRFSFDALPHGVRADRHSDGWDVRTYTPAVVGLLRKE